jgi:hypothetical protein
MTAQGGGVGGFCWICPASIGFGLAGGVGRGDHSSRGREVEQSRPPGRQRRSCYDRKLDRSASPDTGQQTKFGGPSLFSFAKSKLENCWREALF